jgi:hypothetical protein
VLNPAAQFLDVLDRLSLRIAPHSVEDVVETPRLRQEQELALGHRPEQHFMGLWSDGVPVKELLVTQYP